MIAPVLEEIDAELGEKVKVVKVDVDENQETARQFEVMSIPALFVLKDGKVVDQALGYKPKEALVELVSNTSKIKSYHLVAFFLQSFRYNKRTYVGCLGIVCFQGKIKMLSM